MAYREEGYLPEAMLNFLVRLGWSHQDQEIFSKEELVQLFDLESIGKSAGMFNADKLLWLNQHYIKEAPIETLQNEVRYFVTESGDKVEDPKGKRTIDLLRERAKTTKELSELSRFYFEDEIQFDPKAKDKFLTAESQKPLEVFMQKFEGLTDLSEPSIQSIIDEVLTTLEIKMKQLGMPLRVALTGGTVSPSIPELVEVLGKKKVISRLELAITKIAN